MTTGLTLYNALCASSKALGRRLTKEEVIGCLDAELGRGVAQKPVPVPRKRNVLLDALVSACGGDPATTTKPAFRSAANALAEIMTVCPTLTVEEINKRAERYRRDHKDWPLTCPALAKWWSHLGGGPRTKSEANDIYVEPTGWRPVLQNLYQLSNDGIRDKSWLDLGPDTRREVLQRMKA